MEASSYGGLSLNLRESTWQVVAYPASLVKVARLQTFFCRPPICRSGLGLRIKPGVRLPPPLYRQLILPIGTTLPYFARSSAPRALNLLIPRVTFGRCLASYVSRRSTHLESTNSTTCLFVSHLADLLSRGFPTPVHIPGSFFSLCFLSLRSEVVFGGLSITLDYLFRCS